MSAARREQLLSYAVLGVFSVIALYPIVSILLLAFHDRSDLVTGFSIPDSLDFSTFSEAWELGNFGRGLLNSFVVAAAVTVVLRGAARRWPDTRSGRCASAARTRCSTCCSSA